MVRTQEQLAKSKSLEIRVHPEGRYLVSGPKDEPFFWQADTAWEIFHRLDEQEVKLYLDKRAAQGFNVIFGVLFAEHGGVTLPNRQGEWPFHPKDPSASEYYPDVFRPNEKYFDYVDFIIDYAASVGIRVAIQPVWGNYVAGVYHRIEHYFDNVDAARAFGKFSGARYPFLPYLNGGDVHRYWFDDAAFNARVGKPTRAPHVKIIDYGPVFEAFAQGIIEGEATHRPNGSQPFIAFHPTASWLPDTPQPYASHLFPDSKWLTIDGIQSGHSADREYPHLEDPSIGTLHWFKAQNSVDYVREMYATSTRDGSLRPVIDLEAHYESTHYEFRPEKDQWKASNIRQGAWQAVFAGAAGITYGVNSICEYEASPTMDRPPLTPQSRANEQPQLKISPANPPQHAANWFDELDLPGATYVGIATRWFLSRPTYFSRIPDQSVITSDTFDRPTPEDDYDGKDAKLISATRDKNGAWLAVYTPEGAVFEVDLSSLQGDKLTASWFNPRTGEEKSAGPVEKGQVKVVTPSKGKDNHDWVYYVSVA
ncbi:hypothetical protein I316_05984 [Kwoniella heveanensis BCC8398]|uniref:DUF4038 domain-containing protein n=1 Tax=Kwoniella heveanensis BCC8398 TaxID=1296120 RepID=A0A1B9GMR0_9TREE|nr:hypothetical protein I316_05984 [Kwoniella heveanensis BCC8398]